MRIKPEDLAVLKTKIEPLDTPARRAVYINIGHSDTRYRWDLLWETKIKIGDGVGMKGDLDLYGYMTDTHLDTALKSIVPPLRSPE